MFARVENNQVVEYPLSQFDIKKRFPNISFPSDFSSALPPTYVRVQPSSQPLVDELKIVSEGTPTIFDGVWTQVWVETDKYTDEELASYNAKKEEEKKEEVRDIRNSLLSSSDWTQVTDSPVNKTEWAIYRQALRDVTAQQGFPFNVQWPVKPE
jgi:Phage tail assembly chaperone protein